MSLFLSLLFLFQRCKDTAFFETSKYNPKFFTYPQIRNL
ncbi:hypothetical protein M096_4839 [Parabacteroides distasonis str. 3999B T(B) 6]|nr:hypothetical protein M096_4839 [Parabacteroides distasonis str. 3999B T(B) 6]KDS65606.1 hypothetical protein M095_2893 [Parabacteroides distasonis str. 3999B T(B) 4]